MILKRLIVLIVVLAPLFAAAQVKSFDALYDAYNGQKGVDSHKIGKMMISTGRMMHSDIPGGLESVKVLSVKDCAQMEAKVFNALSSDIASITASAPYKLFIDRQEQGLTVKAFTKPVSGKNCFKDVIIWISGPNLLSVMYLEGEFAENEKFIYDLKTAKSK